MASLYPKLTSIKTVEQFRSRVEALEIELPIDDEILPAVNSPFAQAIETRIGTIGNRFSILPMEGWDGTTDGMPTELTSRRWKKFGQSGAKLIWGGEAVAVDPDGRANPNQLMINPSTVAGLSQLRQTLLDAHQESFGQTDDLKVGLQLTHSGRFARPDRKDQLKPVIGYAHPLLDKKCGISDPASAIISDDQLDRLVDQFIDAAKLAQDIGYDFVDIKQCHGYFGHELLSGYSRPGKYGGSFENRTRFVRNVLSGIAASTNGLQVGSRISIFDFAPFAKGDHDIGVCQATGDYELAFGGDRSGCGIDLEEPRKLLALLSQLGVELICTTAGSPYYNQHIQRPAMTPPTDGYLQPEDPLVGVARQINATAELKRLAPEMTYVGSGYSYLQDWLAHVGQRSIADGKTDFVGLGRMVLSYPELPADVLGGKTLQRKKICRTFSDCTTAPRNGMVSGCYPLDPVYKAMPERRRLVELKKASTR